MDVLRSVCYAESSRSEPKFALANSHCHLFIQLDCGGKTHVCSCFEVCEPGSCRGDCCVDARCPVIPGQTRSKGSAADKPFLAVGHLCWLQLPFSSWHGGYAAA